MYNSFIFIKNIIILTIFNFVYNIKKKQTIKNYIIEIASINISKTKIANIVLIIFVLI